MIGMMGRSMSTCSRGVPKRTLSEIWFEGSTVAVSAARHRYCRVESMALKWEDYCRSKLDTVKRS